MTVTLKIVLTTDFTQKTIEKYYRLITESDKSLGLYINSYCINTLEKKHKLLIRYLSTQNI